MGDLRNHLRETAAVIIRYSGVPFLMREILFRNKCTVIIYHDPEPENFRRHISYLSKKYNFISMNQLIEAVRSQNWKGIPPKSLVVTFDDGHKGNYKLLEIIKSYGLHPTIYLCSHIVGSRRKFWWMTGLRDFRKYKKYENKTRLRKLKDRIDYEPGKDYPERQSLNLQEIREMSPYVDFQSHSKFHSILPRCEDIDCRDEIEDSKRHLEQLLNSKVSHFCYPNGDYSEREIKFLKEAGYISGRTLDIGWNGIKSNPYKLKAMDIEDSASLHILCSQITGLFGYLKFLRFGRFDGVHPSYI